jgi:hypothetical protein
VKNCSARIEYNFRVADRILIRFNTKFADDPQGRCWRVLVNGEEALAHRVQILVPCETLTEPLATGEIKHHFLCDGRVEWQPGCVASVVAH